MQNVVNNSNANVTCKDGLRLRDQETDKISDLRLHKHFQF